MHEAAFPSAEFPAPISVRLTYGAGWQPLPLADALVAVGWSEVVPNEFRPNVTVTSKRTTTATLAEAAEATIAALVASPEWEETLREFRTGLGGFDTFRIEGAFIHPQAGTLYQAAETAVVERGPFADVVQVVGTCSAAQAMSVLPDIRAVIATAVLEQS